MQRYFVDADQFQATRVNITGDDAHHIMRVMRAKPGDTIICSDGMSREAVVRIEQLNGAEVVGVVVEELPMNQEALLSVWIAQSLPKGDKLELVVQKATEIGAARFIPFQSERSIVQYDAKKESKRVERWQRIAKEAAEQAHRNRVPLVQSPMSWKALLDIVPQVDLALICYEQEDTLCLRERLEQAMEQWRQTRRLGDDGAAYDAAPKVLVIVGPEGGLSEKEVAEAKQAGCYSISLGRRILRTETAAIVALTCILYESGEMGR